MTHPDGDHGAVERQDVLADLASTTDMVAARLASVLLEIRGLPDEVAGDLKAAGLELEPYVEILEQMGVDPDNPVPEPADLPRTRLPAITTAPVARADGQPFPAPGKESDVRAQR